MTDRTPKPPEEISVSHQVNGAWNLLRSDIRRNADVTGRVALIERTLEIAAAKISAHRYPGDFDWQGDIEHARNLHEVNLAWKNQIEGNFEAQKGYWMEVAKKQYEVAWTLTRSGMSYVLIAHGTVAISCLNALMSDRGATYSSGLKTAIWGSFVGIVLIGVAQALAANFLSEWSNAISSRLVHRPTALRLNALGRYAESRQRRNVKVVERLIYASMLWFVIYIFCSASMIASANN